MEFPVLFAVGDVVYQSLIAAVVTVVLAVMAQRTKFAVDKSAKEAAENLEKISAAQITKLEKAAQEVQNVKTTLRDNTAAQNKKLDGMGSVLDATHKLMNGQMTEQKRLLAVVASAKAEITHDPVDVEAARLADEAYREHEAIKITESVRVGQPE